MRKFPVNVVLNNVRSALNVGAIFRTCDAAGVNKLYLCGITPYPPHNRIPKTALGAIETVEWEHNKSALSVIESLKEDGNQIVSVELTVESTDYTRFDYRFPVTLVLGHEINGVEREILANSDGVVKIPMFGQKESLNVATSAGIVLYELVRRLNSK